MTVDVARPARNEARPPEVHPVSLIEHFSHGVGARPLVLVHGFACDHTDWDGVVARFAPTRHVVSVNLPGHHGGAAAPDEASIERFGAHVADLLRELALEGAVLAGHSMGCRVVVEAALRAPSHVGGLILLDGSQFAPPMGEALRAAFATPDGYETMLDGMFREMFSPGADPALVARVVARAAGLDPSFGRRLLLDLHRYDVTRLDASWRALRVPVLALQATYTNEKRERASLRAGQTTPYLDALRAAIPGAVVEIVPDTGHFPQLEAVAATNAAIARFIG
jgi:pimeloyl-ACP methyl ester carboxylesterase